MSLMPRSAIALIALLPLLATPPLVAQEVRPDDEAELLRIHGELIRAHVENRLDLWMSLEADDFVSINNGTVSYPSVEERRQGRAT